MTFIGLTVFRGSINVFGWEAACVLRVGSMRPPSLTQRDGAWHPAAGHEGIHLRFVDACSASFHYLLKNEEREGFGTQIALVLPVVPDPYFTFPYSLGT